MTKRRLLSVLNVALLLGVPTRGAAKDPAVLFKLAFEPAELRAGEVTTLGVVAAVPKGYHLYSMTYIPEGPMRLRIAVESPRLEAVSEWHAPAPAVELDPNFDKRVEYYDGTVTHRRAFRVGGEPGAVLVRCRIRGQICNPKRCIPFSHAAELALKVIAGAPDPAASAAPELTGRPFAAVARRVEAQKSALPLDEGLLGYLLFAFLAGLAALLTPCVFPMIPITVSFFSKFSTVSMRRSVLMAGTYAASIIATFALLGVGVSAIFGAVGMQAISASPFFNLFLTTLLVVFAFNLFGLFEIKIPDALVNRSSRKERQLTSDHGSLPRQLGGVFFMALTFTLVSFTCTVAFIGIVLAEAAKGNWFYPTVGMLAFASGFSLPFFWLAMFPAWATKLRGKSGDWMVAIKVTLGFFELAAAFKFLSNVDLLWSWGLVTRPLVLTLWTGIFVVAGLYLLRVFRLSHEHGDETGVGPMRMFVALLLIALGGYAASGVRDTKSMGGWLDGWLPPAVYPGQEEPAERAGTREHLAWITDDIPRGMRQGRAEGKPLFIDFTGYTCTNCRYMEGAIFPLPRVRSRLEQMVRVRVFTDGTAAVHKQQREYQIKRFDTAALPLYAIIHPQDDTLLASFADMTQDAGLFVAFLDKGLAAFAEMSPSEGDSTAAATSPASPDAIDLTYPRLNGGDAFALSSLRGHWVLLNFWASWCSPCKKELRSDFPAALARAPSVRLVTISFDEKDNKAAAQRFVADANLGGYVNLFAGVAVEDAGLSAAFGEITGSLPLSYLIAPNGRIVWQQFGSVDEGALDEALAMTRGK